jgi:5-methylcytosine-specific restriction endonuclease McrA
MAMLLIVFIFLLLAWVYKDWVFNNKRLRRRDYYRNVYLKSNEWRRKRHVVLKRDKWLCVRCGAPATEVHHLRYAKKNIGKEPIKWLISICKDCHKRQHSK